MFDVSETVEAKTRAALAVLREYKRGDCVPHSELSKAIGLSRELDADDYYRIVRKARGRLRDEDGIWSTNENNVGFHLLTERETFIDEPRRRAKRARKQLGLSIRAAIAVPPDGLSLNQRRLREAVIEDGKAKRRSLVEKTAKANQFMQPFRSTAIRRVEGATAPPPNA